MEALSLLMDTAGHEALRSRIDVLMHAHTEDIKQAALLEKRIAALMEKHATHV